MGGIRLLSLNVRVRKTPMKAQIFFLIFLLIPLWVHGGNESAVSELNPDLVSIYESLIADGQSTELVGKFLELTLQLKYSSEKYLLFSDTQIIVDAETKYYLIKWKFDPNAIKGILGKSNVKCKVKGRIIQVIKGPTSPGMPYVVAELISVEL